MSEEQWGRVTLVIKGSGFTPEEVAQRLGVPNETRAHKRDRYWSAELGGDPETPLDDQLKAARDFLAEHTGVISGLPGEAQVTLHAGWTPRSPQDGIILDTELISLLSRLGGFVLLDTYTD